MREREEIKKRKRERGGCCPLLTARDPTDWLWAQVAPDGHWRRRPAAVAGGGSGQPGRRKVLCLVVVLMEMEGI